jgi:quinol monooxygenase YgiN
MSFVQIIEFTTSRIDEAEAVMDEWVTATEGKRAASRALLTEDRDHPGSYVQIVEFPSYEQAMDNSALPETSAFASRLLALCDGQPSFRNLDVRRTDALT